MGRTRQAIRVIGVVQGVGFRPFVHRLATAAGLVGFVGNDADGVFVEVEGTAAAVDDLVRALWLEAPPLARVEQVEHRSVPLVGEASFVIAASRHAGERTAAVTADAATCAACLADLRDPVDRRYGYPFVNCTHCGPRLSIVTDVPYDRAATTMADFTMCEPCQAEYDDPTDRRFHAQPTCCPDCGPRLSLLAADGSALAGPVAAAAEVRALLMKVAELLAGGAIVAIKGLGGYHLAVTADDETAVARLRARKHREHRAFALMVPDLDGARRLCSVGPAEAAVLASPAAPVVLLPRLPSTAVAPSVAPGQRTLGLMLPYTPLHHLLLELVGGPIVLTSGNISDEPIAFDDADAMARLGGIADAFVLHDRPIRTRLDDSVVRVVDGGFSPIRRSRGYVPDALRLPWRFPRPVLGCGPELKATFCLARGDRALVSHHIGDLTNYETLTSYVDGIAQWSRLFDVHPEVLAHDLHPDYRSTAWAHEQTGIELRGVQHHHAHIASCLAEHGVEGPVIGVAYDGTGFGPDGTLWGGEVLVADLRGFTRAAHLEAVPLPGGARAVREPWRMAAAYLTAAGEAHALGVRERHAGQWDAVVAMTRSGTNAPLTSSAGRLFDAVAALLGVRDTVGYEGQAAIELELAADPGARDCWPVRIDETADAWVIRGTDLVRGVLGDLHAGVARNVVAGRFHATLAAVTAQVCLRLRDIHGLEVVALSGGVFQNVLLTRLCVEALTGSGFTVLTHGRVPCNDGGISLGQAVIAGALDRAR